MKTTTHNEKKYIHSTFHKKNEGLRKYPLLLSKTVSKCTLLLLRQQH